MQTFATSVLALATLTAIAERPPAGFPPLVRPAEVEPAPQRPVRVDDVVTLPGLPGVVLSPASPRVPRDPALPIADLSVPGQVVHGITAATVIDTRTFPVQIQPKPNRGVAPERRIREIVPAHVQPPAPGEGEPNDLLAGLTMAEERVHPRVLFPTIDSTGWTPPDPNLAVGPGHVVVTVNQSIAWYTKAGVPQFEAPLGSPGNPGFFEPLGAGNFCFDPKCFYDHTSGRYFVLVLETYNSNEAWITLAVSDDDDPNGIWHKYRTDAVILAGTVTCWWDFPGFGYDQDAIYVTSNLFGLSQSGFYGVGIRCFAKAPLLTGAPATHATMRETGFGTLMPALHFGANQAGYAVAAFNSTSVRVYAIRNATTTPTLTFATVSVPSVAGAGTSPTLNGDPVSNAGITMPYWRDGKLVMVQNALVNGRNQARWHEFNTNNFPTSGTVTRVQSGTIDGGGTSYTLFPAIAINSQNEMGVSLGLTSPTQRVAVAATGRRASDPAGMMATPTTLRAGDADDGGRWGDYYAIAVDPTDDTTFWSIGEYSNASGNWDNWVSSFRIGDSPLAHAVADFAGTFQTFAPALPANAVLDVLANDFHSNGLALTISAFSASSTRGGTITRSVGSGPGGRDQLVYTPPVGAAGADSFTYTVTDANNITDTVAVTAVLHDPAQYRNPENPPVPRAGLQARYFPLTAPTTLPDFASTASSGSALVSQINFPATNGVIAGSGRTDDVGVVFEGFVDVPATDLVTFFISSDDGSRVFLGETLIIDHNGLHGFTERASSPIGLKAGRHALRVEYFEATGSAAVVVSRSSTQLAKAVIPTSAWFSVRPCPTNLTADADPAARSVTLRWTPPAGSDPHTLVLQRNGVTIASGITSAVSMYADTPALPGDARHLRFEYALVPESPAAPGCTLRAEAALSSGDVRFAESFDALADSAALAAAGWASTNTATAVENATWVIAQQGGSRANPPTFSGVPTRGRFVISDSDAATGSNPTGNGASHDLVTPPFDCTGLATPFVHADIAAQLNNSGSAVFDIEVMSTQDPVWRLAHRRIAPSRTTPAPAVTTANADGVHGRLSVSLGALAANRSGVRLRFRHFEPTNDWWIAIDNVLVDNVSVPAQGATTVLANVPFSAGIPAGWALSGLQSGVNTWTTADPCRRSVSANGGAFPRQSGRASHRLGSQFAIVDSACGITLSHDEFLRTPVLDCSLLDRVYLSFKTESVLASGVTQEVLVSIDGGATFSPFPVYAYSGGALAQAAEDPSYDAKTLHVPSAARRAAVVFAFHFAGAPNGWWWAIDDVKVTGDTRPVCPADFNGDGIVEPGDLDEFITTYFTDPPGNAAADFNNDGLVEPGDLDELITAFFDGCEGG
ncbi:MAG: PA14 domain-containing protein [Phycisphaerales bacterium]